LGIQPAYVGALAQLAALDLMRKNPKGAIERVQKQIALAPKSGDHQQLLGDIYASTGDLAKAEAAYIKATELNPQLVESYVRLAQLYWRTQKLDQALAKTDDILKKN